MNESNSKFQKNPLPWLALMTTWSIVLACLCGYIGGCTQSEKAEDRLHDDRVEARAKLKAAAELEAKVLAESKKLEKTQRSLDSSRAVFIASRNRQANLVAQKRDSVMASKANVKDSSLAPGRVLLKGSLLKVKDTGRTFSDLDAAKSDSWYSWSARFHYILENGELKTITISFGELTVIQSEERVVSIETAGNPDVESVLNSLSYRSGSRGDYNNRDINKAYQVYIHIPVEEFNKYVELCHN